MIRNPERIGNFTSSMIYNLMTDGKAKGTFGKPFYTYVEEKNMERRLGRSIAIEVNSKPLSWGSLLEGIAFNLLGDGYELISKQTIIHPEYSWWSGSPDGIKGKDTVLEIKAPATLKSFCTFADCKDIDEVRDKHPDGEKYFWQVISNAILTGAKYGELVIYCPYFEELDMIRDTANNFDGDQKRFEWIALWATDDSLPYLIQGKHYKHLYMFRFDILEEDKKRLTERVIEAGKLLIPMEPDKKVYKPTKEQIEIAQEKIRFMQELKAKMKSKSIV